MFKANIYQFSDAICEIVSLNVTQIVVNIILIIIFVKKVSNLTPVKLQHLGKS